MKNVTLHPFTLKSVARWNAGKGTRKDSIHPRVVNGFQQHKKVNTAQPRKAA